MLRIARIPRARWCLANPTVAENDRKKVFEDLLKQTKATEEVSNFSRLLLERGRFSALLDIHARFTELLDGRTGRVVAHVTSAVALDDKKLAEIKAMLAGKEDREVVLNHSVDATLIGGLVIRHDAH